MRIAELWVVGLLLLGVACARPVSTPATPGQAATELVVGTSGDSPPYSTRRAGTIAGLEIDLAMDVGKVLGRPVRIVNVPWSELFDALAGGRVDVVMAGVTVTPEREARFAFAEPYLRTGIYVLVRAEDRQRLGTGDAVCQSPLEVGVVASTTGERHVRERCPALVPRVYPTADDAVLDVANGRLGAIVHDGPVLAYLRSQQGVALDLVPMGRTDERLAWMVRQDDTALRQALDGALVTLRRDGTLDRELERWIPQVEHVRAP